MQVHYSLLSPSQYVLTKKEEHLLILAGCGISQLHHQRQTPAWKALEVRDEFEVWLHLPLRCTLILNLICADLPMRVGTRIIS